MDNFIIDIDYSDILLALVAFNINELILYKLYKYHPIVLFIYNVMLLILIYLHYKYKHKKTYNQKVT
jgi:uncharacterized membrane protein AbrB (regulator of aidB expression)